MARTGRPKSLNPKQHVVTIRLNDAGWERYSNMLALADVSGAELIKVAARNPVVLTTWMNCRLPR